MVLAALTTSATHNGRQTPVNAASRSSLGHRSRAKSKEAVVMPNTRLVENSWSQEDREGNNHQGKVRIKQVNGIGHRGGCG